ncbi:MAG TPA: hypothetical protein VHM28_01920 [Anaerolineales bacterium]|jgi:hypothetical protein|nr:hypothetical protein [Anaerolineales bacterium]
MFRFFVESPHAPEECDKIIREIHNAGYLHHFEWGCHDGVHTGWAFIETDNIEHVKQIVPWSIRDKAHFVKVENFAKRDVILPHSKKKEEN